MTTQELEKIHGPLVGRTGRYRPPPYGGPGYSIGAAIQKLRGDKTLVSRIKAILG